jgi:Ca2+-binding RTX toxin-like protein
MVETLESRTLLSAGAQLGGGILQVKGDTATASTIIVKNSADGAKVEVSINAGSGTVIKSFDKTKVNLVRIIGGSKADTITIDQSTSLFAIKTRIHGKEGNDTITTGNELDTIGGGLGTDVINSGGGNDLVFGGRDNDTLTGGEGNDTLWGGKGNDSIEGGNGDDKLGGFYGTNVLHGTAGRDTFVSRGNLTLNPQNDYNPAEDVLKAPGSGDDGDEPPTI